MLKALAPGDTVGIFGGGQLGRMLAMAASKLGLKAHIYAPESDSPAFDAAALRSCAAYDDLAALRAFAASAAVITYEFENVPAFALAAVEETTPVFPPRRALAAAQDRLAERRLLAQLNLQAAPHRFVASAPDLPAAFAALQDCGSAFFLKKTREGYDGKGQFRIADAAHLAPAAAWLGAGAAILEAEIPFAFEISVIGVRGRDGAKAYYDAPRNRHEDGVLRESISPSGISQSLQSEAESMAGRIMDALDYVGVIGVELFVAGEAGAQRLIVNEIAPRVHNSGHWTLEACAVSQFENHIRAIAGWPLGATARHSDARMTNLIGGEAGAWREHLTHHGRSLHLYGKGEARDGRKMGHYCDIGPKDGAGGC